MRSIYDIIDLVKQNPKLYLGKNSLTNLYMFLNGSYVALELNEINEFPKFKLFHVWVRQHLGLEPLSIGYRETLLSETQSDEEKAMKLFFCLLEKYKAASS